MLRSTRFHCSISSKPLPKKYFDLKAFRKGVSEKKQALIEAEKREIRRVYAKDPPENWTVVSFLKVAKLADLSEMTNTSDVEHFYSEVASCFEDWSDFISSDSKDVLKVSNLLNARQVKKLIHCIELFNHGLFGPESANVEQGFHGVPPARQGAVWTPEEDASLIELTVNGYDYTFGDVWLYVSFEMERTMDEVYERFVEIYLKPRNRERETEIALSKSFRPLLMNRQFRIIPPQCYVIPTDDNFPSICENFHLPEQFKKYRHSGNF
jgi:hypothetical protein